MAPGPKLKFHPEDPGLKHCPSPAASEIQVHGLPPCGGVQWGARGEARKMVDDGGAAQGRTHVSAADPLQQESGHFSLPVKLRLGHSELLLGLGKAEWDGG